MLSQSIEHIIHTPNLHELTFHDVQFETLETFFTLFDDIFSAADPKQPLRLLIYSNLETPPVSYMVAQHQKMKDRYAKLALKIAVLHPPSRKAQVVFSLILMVNRAINLRMFTVDQREAALDWLMR